MKLNILDTINIILFIILIILIINKINNFENFNVICGGYCEYDHECNQGLKCNIKEGKEIGNCCSYINSE